MLTKGGPGVPIAPWGAFLASLRHYAQSMDGSRKMICSAGSNMRERERARCFVLAFTPFGQAPGMLRWGQSEDNVPVPPPF